MVAYEDDQFGYPKTEGYSLHVSEANRDKLIQHKKSLSPALSACLQENIVDSELYRQVRDKGGDFFTQHAIW